MTLLGSTAEPGPSQEWFGLNSTNQIMTGQTLPAGGPWRVYRIGTWCNGYNESANINLCLWTASGTFLRKGPGIVAPGSSLGNPIKYESDITEYVVAGGTTLYIGFWRDPNDNVQHPYSSGGTHIHDTAGGAPESLGAWTSHSGKSGGWLYYELANTAPTAPTIAEPDQNEVVTDQTPVLDWTHNDPDGDAQNAFEVEIGTSSSFSTLVVNTGKVTSGTTGYTVTTSLSRGTTYYLRVRTWDPSGAVSPWSSTRTFKIAGKPTSAVSSPVANGAAPLYYTAGTDTVPKLKVTWATTCPDGGTQTSASVRIWNEAGSAVVHTHAHASSSGTASITGFSPVNGTKYQVRVIPVCSHGVTGDESPAKLCRVRWGRASYKADLTITPLSLSVAVSSTTNSGQVVMEYASSAAATPEPTDWKATIAEVGKLRYQWHRVTLIPAATAAPVSPALNSVTYSFSFNVLVADKWTLDPQFAVDQGTFVYGTQSIRHEGDGTVNYGWQLVDVTPDTDYIFSGRIKTAGSAGAGLAVREPGGGGDIVVVSATADTDWTRYSTPVFNSGARNQVEVCIVGVGLAGTSAWFDALKLEASRVVTPWTPGFLGTAVTLDAGGMQVDGSRGGVFRVRSVDGLFQAGTDDVAFGAKRVVQDSMSVTDASTLWPQGHSVMSVQTAVGWPAATGTVVTWNYNSARMAQWFYKTQESIGTPGASWYRTGHSTNTPNQWTAWQRMDRRQRWVSVEDQPYSPFSGATRTTAIDTTVELTMLPSDGSVRSVEGVIIASCTAISNSTSFRVRNYDSGTSGQSQGGVVYPQVVGTYCTSSFHVTVGGTGSRSIRYAFAIASGTVTYYMGIHGYWTDA